MSVIEVEGWDHKQFVPPKPGWTYTVPATTPQAGRFGTGFLYRSTGAGTSTADYTGFAPTAGPLTQGVAVFLSSSIETTVNTLEFREGSITHLYLRPITQAGQLGLYRGDGTLLASTAATAFHPDAWDYTEFKATIADSGGTAVVKLNGTQVISFTGDTRNGGTGVISGIRLSSGDSSGGAFYDDYVLLDSLGPAPYNDFLGDVRVSTLVGNGDGTFSQLLGSDGNSVQNYLQVNEVPPVGTTYNGSATVGQRDTYAMTDLPTTSGQVLAVRPLLFAHKADAGAGNLKVVTRLAGGTERVEALQAMTATLVTPHLGDLRTVDPANAAWTIASVNGAEFGMEVA